MRSSAVLLLCVCGLLWPDRAWASRAVFAKIVVFDGQVELNSNILDSGKEDRDACWRHLKTMAFGGSGAGFAIKPDPDNRELATLKGEMTVSVDCGGTAKVTKLRLLRDKQDKWKWRIHPDDVEAMLKHRE